METSIIITTYNRPDLLRFGLESLASQNLDKSNVEVIILNDGNPEDGTCGICELFSDILNIKYFATKRDFTKWRVPGFAINFGIKQAAGKYIFLSCAEMFHLDNTVAEMLKILRNDSKALTIPKAKDDDGSFLSTLIEGKIPYNFDKLPLLDNVRFPFFLGLSKQEIVSIGGYDEEFDGIGYDDNDIIHRLTTNKCHHISVPSRVVHLYHKRLSIVGENRVRLLYNEKMYHKKLGNIYRNKSIQWGNSFLPDNVEFNNKKWTFNNIPKLIHFYWGGSSFTFLRYISIMSFIKYNPDWHVKLHIPEQMGNSSKIGEDYMSKLYGVEIIRHNFDKYRFPNNTHEVYKSDFLRWILLSTEGGVWSDNDIIYTKPISYIEDNISENQNIETGFCMYDKNNPDSHAIGFLMASQNNPVFKEISEISRKIIIPESNSMTNYLVKEDLGCSLFNKYFSTLVKKYKIHLLSPQSVYSILWDKLDLFLSNNTKIENYNQAIGFHYYGGHPKIYNLESKINHTNYKQFDNFISKLVGYTLGET